MLRIFEAKKEAITRERILDYEELHNFYSTLINVITRQDRKCLQQDTKALKTIFMQHSNA
jgi:hypothetical protein